MTDDDGSGTVGTIFSNAWKTELYNQIDAIGSVAALGAVSTDGSVLQNPTPATAGVPVQQSPRLRFRSHVWNTTAVAADNTDDWWIESVPASGATPSGLLQFGSSRNGAAATFPLTLTSAGLLNVGLDVSVGRNIQLSNTGQIFWASRTDFASPADGQLNITNNAATAGVGLDVTADAIAKFRTRAQTGDAAIKAAFYTSSTIAALTVTTNTIAPTALIHQLGAGLIKTITVPATMASPGFLLILPTAAFTYDATGNILVPAGGGTAVINKLMVFVWDGTKWTPSY
jgi:hypothetical protein